MNCFLSGTGFRRAPQDRKVRTPYLVHACCDCFQPHYHVDLGRKRVRGLETQAHCLLRFLTSLLTTVHSIDEGVLEVGSEGLAKMDQRVAKLSGVQQKGPG